MDGGSERVQSMCHVDVKETQQYYTRLKWRYTESKIRTCNIVLYDDEVVLVRAALPSLSYT